MTTPVQPSLHEHDLEQLGFTTIPVRITSTDPKTEPRAFSLRLLLPKAGDETNLGWEHLLTMAQQATGADRTFYQWVMRMVQFYQVAAELDPHQVRRFNLDTLDHSDTFRHMAKMTGLRGTPSVDRLITFAGETITPTAQLLHEAIYEQAEIHVPFSQPLYLRFRKKLLAEFEEVQDELAQIRQNAITRKRQKVPSDKRLSSQHVWGLLLKTAAQIEARHAAQFTDLVEEAVRLQAPIADEMDAQHLVRVEADGATLTPQYVACIKAQLDIEAVNRLLWRTIERYEQAFEIAPLRSLELIEISESVLEGESCVDDVPDDPTPPPHTPEFEQYLSLWSAYKTDDVLEKWHVLCWITTNLVNRTECLRLLHREAEAIYHGLVNYTFTECYRAIRRHLTRPERRAYALLYFGLPHLYPHIAFMDPVIRSFFTGMDEDTRTLIFLVLIFKVRQWKDRVLDQELERRWRAYLRLYPHWVGIIQEEDREAKHQQTAQRTTASFQDVVGIDKSGAAWRLEETVFDPKNTPANLLQAIVREEQGELESWAHTYCAPKQATHVIKYFRDHNTEAQIAQKDGITQQAVNKSLHAGIERIAAGLRRDGLLDTT